MAEMCEQLISFDESGNTGPDLLTLVAKMVDLLLEPGFYQRGLADQFRGDEGP